MKKKPKKKELIIVEEEKKMSDFDDMSVDDYLEEEGSRSDVGSMISSKKSSVYERDPFEMMGKKKFIENSGKEERSINEKYGIVNRGNIDYNSFFGNNVSNNTSEKRNFKSYEDEIIKNCKNFLPTIFDENNADRNDTFYGSPTYYLVSIGNSIYAIKIPSYLYIAMLTCKNHTSDNSKWEIKLGIFDTSIPNIGRSVKYLNEECEDLIKESFNKFYDLFWRKIEENSKYCASLYDTNNQNNLEDEDEEDDDKLSNYSRSMKVRTRYYSNLKPDEIDESVIINEDLDRILDSVIGGGVSENIKKPKNIEIQEHEDLDINDFNDMLDENPNEEDEENFNPNFDDDMLDKILESRITSEKKMTKLNEKYSVEKEEEEDDTDLLRLKRKNSRNVFTNPPKKNKSK